MRLLIEKTEKRDYVEYKIKKGPWFVGWAVVLLIVISGTIYRRQNPYLFLVGFLVLFLWVLIITISSFPAWIPFFTGQTITKEGSWINARWKVKK